MHATTPIFRDVPVGVGVLVLLAVTATGWCGGGEELFGQFDDAVQLAPPSPAARDELPCADVEGISIVTPTSSWNCDPAFARGNGGQAASFSLRGEGASPKWTPTIIREKSFMGPSRHWSSASGSRRTRWHG